MSGHTPEVWGPLKLRRNGPVHVWDFGRGRYVAQRVTEDYVPLIAAAPDLLALAIQYADECVECDGTGTRWTRPNDPQDSTEYPCEACADIRAVIDRAEGR